MKRETNIEILRILAMLMVTLHHALVHSGLVAHYTYGEVGYFIVWLLEALSLVAVNCFVLITGYFMINSKVKLSKILKIVLQVWVFSILCALLAKLVFQQPIGLKALVLAVFPVTGKQYWFASAYVCLLAIAPLLNKLIRNMKRKEHLGAIAILSLVFCVVPTVFFWGQSVFGFGMDFVWFTVLYFVAAYIRLYGISFSAKKCFGLYFVLIFLGFLSNIAIGGATKLLLGYPTKMDFLFHYNSILFFPAAVFLFAGFTKVQIRNKLVTKFSCLGAYVFGAYLISDHALIRIPLWNFLNLPAAAEKGILAMLGAVIAITIVIMAVGCVIEAIRAFLTRVVGINKLLLRTDAYVSGKIAKITKTNSSGEENE